MRSIEQKLAQKGWTGDEINKAMRILKRGETKKTTLWVEQAAYWIALFLAVLGNFIMSVVIIPFLLIMEGWELYASLFLFGFLFGILFELLVCSIEKLTMHHYIIAGAFIPAIGIMNFYIMTNLSNKLAIILNKTIGMHNPLVVSVIYISAFVLPYLIHKFRMRTSTQ